MGKHTKGPWSHRNGRIFQTDHEVLTIANVARAYDGDYSPSNGDLLAAAPELLEALEEVVAVFESNPSSITDTVWVTGDRPETLYDCCRAAIAKAKGEQ